MPEDITIAKSWEQFAALAIPKHAPPQQRDAMYQAFLAGCATVSVLVETIQRERPSNLATFMRKWEADCKAELQKIAGVQKR
jgi:hypothetical protein